MRPIGFSTGALSLSEFRSALYFLHGKAVNAIELSALRYREIVGLLKAIDHLDLSQYQFKAVHVPSSFNAIQEGELVQLLDDYVPADCLIVLHPDTIHDFARWERFGKKLAIENMDRRKPIGRTTEELRAIFKTLPEAQLCFDIGHARQIDTTMTEAYRILTHFANKLAWLHVSEVNTLSRHEALSFASISSFAEVAYLIPESVPVILESRIHAELIDLEIENARRALPINYRPAMIA